jgi:hypothetical protein
MVQNLAILATITWKVSAASMVKYLLDHYEATFSRKPVKRYGMLQLAPGQSPSGYGRKISTDYMAEVLGRKRRVYAICFSNAASHYVLVKGEAFYIRDFEVAQTAGK